jgi:hypothetical protein
VFPLVTRGVRRDNDDYLTGGYTLEGVIDEKLAEEV